MRTISAFDASESLITTYSAWTPSTLCLLCLSYLAVYRILHFRQTNIPEKGKYRSDEEVDDCVFEAVQLELKVLPSNCSYTTHAEVDEDDALPIVVKKVRRDSPSRCDLDADCAPDIDCWGTRRRQRKRRLNEYIGYAAVYYILSRVVRRKMKV
ncbi:hypothetical protein MHU86_24188 [Fragilaria crotonensis]|nr:hypothetical protein MHU86_24188 [Fragilaria crotonensis]